MFVMVYVPSIVCLVGTVVLVLNDHPWWALLMLFAGVMMFPEVKIRKD